MTFAAFAGVARVTHPSPPEAGPKTPLSALAPEWRSRLPETQAHGRELRRDRLLRQTQRLLDPRVTDQLKKPSTARGEPPDATFCRSARETPMSRSSRSLIASSADSVAALARRFSSQSARLPPSSRR